MTSEIRTIAFVVALAACTAIGMAQEIAFIDVTGVKPRLDLRYPPSPPAKCTKEGVCSGGGYGVMSMVCGGAAPGELRANLTHLDRTEYIDGDTADIEVTIENVGKIPLQIPWTPQLADLQPADENAKFVVDELQIGLFLNWSEGYSSSLGWLDLHGDPKRPGTIVTLNPGERVRILGQIKISATHANGIILPALELAQRASAKILFREVEYIPHPGGMSERISNASPKEIAGTDQPVHIIAAVKNN
jgi:hypothetical protein